MNDMSDNVTALNIAAVARDTGLSRDTLRVWERRYGFPAPERDEHDERLYPAEQVEKLRLIRRLLDQGARPGKLIGESTEALHAMIAERAEPQAGDASEVSSLIQYVRLHRSSELSAALRQSLLKQGLQRFVQETVAPLNHAIGEAWLRGELSVPEEHFYSEQVQNVLRSAIGAQPAPLTRPRVLLTTLPGEQHVLGLLMVEATLVPEGVSCLSLGASTPLADIGQAAASGNFEVVALSFSSAYPLRQAIDGARELRALLPGTVSIWAGGSAVRGRQNRLPEVRVIEDLPDLLAALAQWRAANQATQLD